VLELVQETLMRATFTLDDNLIKTAQEYTGLTDKSALMREALKALIERQASRRLAELGGASAKVAYMPRRRTKAK
jgi:Arc/MetJ family transcription regulator